MAYNAWLRGQRKSDLVELADSIGYTGYEGMKKIDLENALDEFIAENTTRLSATDRLRGYFNSRNKALGSPVKRESRSSEDGIKIPRRRTTTKLAEEVTPEYVRNQNTELAANRGAFAKTRPTTRDRSTRNSSSRTNKHTRSDDPASPPRDTTSASSTALIQTPARALTEVASQFPLPATPAHIAEAVDRSAVAVRRRVSTYYQESGITEASQATREALSTVTSVLFTVAGFELWNIRREILSNVYAFTIPAINALGTPDYPVYVPDMFLLLTSSFWSPALTWVFTSFLLPSLAGWFFNLSATSAPHRPGRPRPNTPDYVVDPLTFSIAKALISYVVYAQGVTFSGLLSENSIDRLNTSVYGGYKGILVGTAITGLVSIYDAVLRK